MVLNNNVYESKDVAHEQTGEAAISETALMLAKSTGREIRDDEKPQFTALATIYHEVAKMLSEGPDPVKDPHRVFHLLGFIRDETVPSVLRELRTLNAPLTDVDE